MTQPPAGSFWDAIRTWADSAGLLLPDAEGDRGGPPRPKVPQSVCDSCPICQAAATLDQVNPQVIADLADVARSVLAGMGSALASAAEQRLSGTEPTGRNQPAEPTEPTGSTESTGPTEPTESTER
jgi:hypothetical protein